MVFSNLKPKKLGDVDGWVFSNGMVMSASTDNNSAFELIRPNESKKIFLRVF